MATSRSNIAAESSTDAVALWIHRGIGALWLLTVTLVPLAFFRPDQFLSEAVIGYVEVPKLALLRTLVGLMTMLWLMEWVLNDQIPLASHIKNHGLRFEPGAWYGGLANWLRGQPTRWVILAAWAFLGTTMISTVLSASFGVSLWGEIPGQDGFAAYNIVTYILLFGVIASHLKIPAQLWRLLGAVVVVGVLVSGYAVLQHFGHDFLGVLEATGGGRARVTSTMANAVFAGAAMLLPIGVSLVLATVTLTRLAASAGGQPELRPKVILLAVLGLWVVVMVVQFLGIIFTFSRGPWLGTLLALVGFLTLAGIFVGWRIASWAALVAAMASGITWLVLQESGGGTITASGLLAVSVLILGGLLVVSAVFGGNVARLSSSFPQTQLLSSLNSRVVRGIGLVSGTVAVGVMASVIGLRLFTDRSIDPGEEPPAASTSSPTTLAVQQRFASITGEVTTGSLSQRGLIWQASWQLIQHTPWFEFERLSFPWLRPLIGYGPDMFRYAFLLESTSSDTSFLPLEPDHAHNFFIHQAVEQGVLGLLSSLGLFVAVLGVGGYLLVSKRTQYSEVHKLVLIGLLAVMAGRFVEQMVGLARVSDLTIFWTLLAVFVALPVVMRAPGEEAVAASPGHSRPVRPRDRRRSLSRSRASAQAYDWPRFVTLALVAWAIGGIIALTWVKTINYPRAGLVAAAAVERFQRGDYQGAVAGLDRAIDLAPDVPVYYNFKSSVLAAYLQDPQVPPEPECNLSGDGTPYKVCLVEKIYVTNLRAVQQRPYYWRSRLALANSALALGRNEEAIRLYRETVALVPASWPLYNRLAEAYIDVGQPEMALEVLEDSLAITQDSSSSNEAHRLQVLATEKLSNLEDSTAPVP